MALKRIILIILILSKFSTTILAQNDCVLQGKITLADNQPIANANIIVKGLSLGTTTNSNGYYKLEGLSPDSCQILVSFIGYQPIDKTIEIKEGVNTIDFTLTKEIFGLDEIKVSAQKVKEDIGEVPIAISVIDSDEFNEYSIEQIDELSNLVPGLNVQVQSNQRPNFVIRGLASDNFNPGSQPRVSVFYNNIPVNTASGSVLELYDMERVEVLKGPQGSLFGRSAMNGSVHYIANLPSNNVEGNLSVGTGSYNRKLVKGMLNIPISKKISTRIAGIYNHQDGYIENTFGGKLNGKHTIAGRFSTKYQISPSTVANLMVNYQNDDAPGIAFMSKTYPNTDGIIDVFGGKASFDQGEKLATKKENLNTLLEISHDFSKSLSLTSTTSLRNHTAYERWDGDGSAAKSLDMSEDIESRQFYQEIRFNYNSHEKFTAFAGASYWREHIVQDYTFMPNEQHMFHLLFDPSYMITPDGHPVSVPALPMIPQLGPLGGTPLPTKHTELTTAESTNKSVELFIDGTYAITDKLSITGGARLIFDDLSLYNRQEFTGGEQSVLGYLTGSAPNMLFPVRAPSDTSETFRSIVERVILNYKVSNNLILFTSFSKGRRPNVLQSRADNGFEILDSEIVKSLEFGIKGKLNNRIMFDGNLFYQKYSNFQTSAWVSDQESGEFTLIVKDGGRATSYGFESTIRFALAKSLKAYISYAYINARFDDENDKGEPHPYAGNRFRLTPDNSVGIGLNWQQKISSGISFFASPVYSYKSKIYFEDANSEELSQEAIELLNLNIGVKLTNLNTTISAYSKNILDEKYLLSAGNTGSLFKIPTFVPATPRTFGIYINYQF